MKNFVKFLTVILLMIVFVGTELAKSDYDSLFFQRNIDALKSLPGLPCRTGGPGARSCSIKAGVTIMGVAVDAECSIECRDGYYACCSFECYCIEIGSDSEIHK